MRNLSLLLALALTSPVWAKHETLRICHLSSDIGQMLPRANDLSGVYGGFQAAINGHNQTHFRKAEFLIPPSEKEVPSLPDQILWAEKNGCHIIVGLVTSRDALLAAKFIKEKSIKIMGFSSTATADELSQSFPTILSASTSRANWTKALTNHLAQTATQDLFIISKPDDVYSLLFTKSLTTKLKGKPFTLVQLDANDQISEDDLKKLNHLRKAAILYTTYPMPSVPSLIQLATKSTSTTKKHWTIYGTQSWNEVQIFQTQEQVMRNLPPVFIFSPWDQAKGSPKFQEFKTQYRSLFLKDPDHDSAYDFDVTQMILRCFDAAPKKAALRIQLSKCLSKPFVHNGVTGQYQFDGQHSHPNRKEVLLPLDLSGMTPKESK